MDIYYIRVHAHPTESHPQFGQLQGAYINCWIRASSPIDAERIALSEINAAHWTVDATECAPDTEFARTEDNAGYLHQAQLDGECYVFHTYSFENDTSKH